MRKKSHLSLAGYIVDIVDADMIDHPLAFRFGSLEPDLVPSFITTKHRIDLTFHKLEKKINKVIDEYDKNKGMTIGLSKDLGVITHYIADYFTFPHNTIYPGNLKDHCVYEGEMKLYLRQYLLDGRARAEQKAPVKLASLEQLYAFIQKTHDEYLQMKHSIEEDCCYIVNLCYQVVTTIIELFTANCHQAALAQNYMLSGHLLGGTI